MRPRSCRRQLARPMRPVGHIALAALAAALLAALAPPAAAQTCGNIDARAPGHASGRGVANDAPALAAMDADNAIGLIYLPPGTYRIATSLTLKKPIFGEVGAVLVVGTGVTLTIQAQPEHPKAQLFALQGTGQVQFGRDTVRVLPEWFGARGNGIADDSAEVQAAFNAAAATSTAMLYLTGNYGLAKELQLTNKATIMSEPTAGFTSVAGNTRGVTFSYGGYSFKNVLPHFNGFGEWCVRFFGADLGSFQLQTLSNCGDAIRFEASPSPSDQNTVLDNTVWFDVITNSRYGITMRAQANCNGANCIYQGNQVIGTAINGCAGSGPTGAIGFFFYHTGQHPAWDSNQFNLARVNPCQNNVAYNLLVTNQETETAREVVKVGSLGAVAPGANLFYGRHQVLQASIGLREQQPDGAGRLIGLASLVEFWGQTTPPPGSPPVRAMTQPNTKARFNGGRSLLGNYFTIQAVPDQDWLPGANERFYVYHQLATGELYHVKCDAPRQAGTNLPIVACTRVQDMSVSGGVKQNADELLLDVINLSGRTIPAGTVNVFFNLAVATLGNP